MEDTGGRGKVALRPLSGVTGIGDTAEFPLLVIIVMIVTIL